MNLDIHIIDTCNRNCGNCFHYSCIAKKSNEKNSLYFEELFKTLHPSIKDLFSNINILGGEPFLNKDLKNIIQSFRKYFCKNTIIIFTNGIILTEGLRNKDSEIINIINTIIENNVKIFVSVHSNDYQNYKKELMELMKSNGFKIDFITVLECNSFIKIDFEMKDNKVIANDANENYKKCIVKPVPNKFFTTFQLVGNKLIGCAKAAYCYILNEYLDNKIILNDSDQLDISKVESKEEIINFINKGHLDFCKYCVIDNSIKVPCNVCKDYKQFLKCN